MPENEQSRSPFRLRVHDARFKRESQESTTESQRLDTLLANKIRDHAQPVRKRSDRCHPKSALSPVSSLALYCLFMNEQTPQFTIPKPSEDHAD